MRNTALVLGLAAVLAAGGALAAESDKVYRWVDKNGVQHYSDRPSASSEEVDLKPSPSPGTSGQEDVAAVAAAALCEQKTKQLASYKQAPSITESDALGKQREYTTDEIKQLIAQTEKQKDAACGPPSEETATAPAETPAEESAADEPAADAPAAEEPATDAAAAESAGAEPPAP